MPTLQDRENLLKQLSAAFGDKKAKEIVKKIEKIKKQNNNKVFSFYFNEDGSFTAVEKKEEEHG